MREAVKINLCEILVANVFGLENPTFWPKVTFLFLLRVGEGVEVGDVHFS